jgi:DNA-binding NtrC family response regulator
LALSDASVLIQGETGIGKATLASALHAAGGNQKAPCVGFVCTGLSAEQLERSLVEPTAPGIGQARRPSGRLDAAQGGTLLLQDVCALDGRAQAVLLSLLSRYPSLDDNRTPRRVLRPRLISTARVPLAQLVRRGHFRADLYFRLASATVEIPPLRARRADVLLLGLEMLDTAAARLDRAKPSIEAEAQRLLSIYSWPRNIRQLQGVMTQALLEAADRPRLTISELTSLLVSADPDPDITIPVGCSLAEAEQLIILQTLAAAGGRRDVAAKSLGVSRRTLYAKLAHYKVSGGHAAPSWTKRHGG